MLRKPDHTAHFMPLPRSVRLGNPHTGFQSFQRFRGDRLNPDGMEGWQKEYLADRTDIVRAPGEDYPHPDTRIAYFRVCWKDFEPEEGCFRYDLVERLLTEADAQGQTLLFRLMPHTTRPDQDVPEWLKRRIPTPQRSTDPVFRVKESPFHAEFFSCFARAVTALGARFDGDRRLEGMDISLCGAWGEGHNIDFFPPEWPQLVMNAYLNAFPSTLLIGQINAPKLIMRANEVRPVGFRCDCLGDMENGHMDSTYPRNIAQMPDVWRKAPALFESCWTMRHWLECGWDIGYIAEQSLKWHISSFNAKSGAIPAEWRADAEEWASGMGYRLALRFVDYPTEARPCDTLHMNIWMENEGVAPLYHPCAFMLRLKGERFSTELETPLRPVDWLPGDTVSGFDVALPSACPEGDYLLEAALVEPGRPAGGISLASKGRLDEGWLEIGPLRVLPV